MFESGHQGGGGGGDDYNDIPNIHGSYQSGSYNNGSSHISSDLYVCAYHPCQRPLSS